MLTVAVCTDDKSLSCIFFKNLDYFCFSLPEKLDIQAKLFDSPQNVLQYLANHMIHIIFLDIEMPDSDGFSLAESLYYKYPEIITICISSRQETADNSTRHHPFRFIHRNQLNANLKDTLSTSLSTFMNDPNTCLFHTTEGDQYLSLKRLLYLESQKNYVMLHCSNAVYKCRGNLSKMEHLLSEHGFYRIHASFLINMEYLKAMPARNKAALADGIELDISRSRIAGLKDKYIEYLKRKAFP